MSDLLWCWFMFNYLLYAPFFYNFFLRVPPVVNMVLPSLFFCFHSHSLPPSLPFLPSFPSFPPPPFLLPPPPYPQGTKPESPRKSMSPFRSTTPKAASPDPFSAGPGETSPKKIPLDIESPKRSSTSTPTMYDIIDV